MAKTATARKILAVRTSQLPVHLTEPEIREAGKRLAQHEGELGIHAQKEKRARWTQGKKKSGLFDGVLAAKADAELIELERLADQKLQNAGAGELTKKELKGPLARKRGRHG